MIERNAAKNIAKVLVNASGLKSLPFLRLEGENGKEGNCNNQQREKERLADLLRRLNENLGAVSRTPRLFPLLEALVRVFHHDDGGIYHRADGNGDTARGT